MTLPAIDSPPDAKVVWTRAARRRALRLSARTVRGRLRLPPKLSLSEWADQYRVLSPEASAQPGQWQTARVPYLREIMDTISGREYQDVTVVKCSQSAGSEAILNAAGFYMDQEPCSILVIQPNVKPMAEAFSKSRIAPMIRDCVRLAGKVKDPRSRDSGNTILQKSYPGGTLFIMGANSPAGLASNPIRVVLADELDRWPTSAGTEGDPLALAEARQITYRHRKKRVKVSSPGNQGESRIEKEWELSDQRHYYVPCPHCGHEQPLEWKRSEPDHAGKPTATIVPGKGDYCLLWEKSGEGDSVEHKPETAAYCCRSCGALIEETHKPAMLAAGQWVKHNPKSKRAGFHIAGLLSPWVRWSEIASKWLAVKDDDEQRKTFFNTLLGLLYVGSGEEIDYSKLSSRRESYGADVPAGVGILTMFIDVQDDRIECDVWGWGVKEESWHIRLERFHGDPDSSEVWEQAEALRTKVWKHASGADMRIRVCVVDSGYKQDAVFRWVKSKQGSFVFASKGVENAKQPLSRMQRANRDGVKVWNVNPTAFKDTLFSRLKRKAAGPGYMHFGQEETTRSDENYFAQFGAEKREVEFVKGRAVIRYKQIKKRNEAIDLYVGNLVALRTLGLNTVQQLGTTVAAVQAEGAAKLAAAAKPDANPDDEIIERPAAKRRRGNWATGGGQWGLK